MRRFTLETAIAAIELEQMLVDYWHEVDHNDAVEITKFYTDDCIAQFGETVFRGHEGINLFYANRRETIREQQAGQLRTGRHTYYNLQIIAASETEATLRFLVCTYSGSGPLPVFDATLPTAISEARFETRRAADGGWRVAGFYGGPLFIGSDPLARKVLGKQ